VELRFAVLGPVRAWRGDTEVDLGSPQQRAILANLLLHEGAAVSPDQLIQATWGVDAPRAAIGMVRSYVSRLRAVLGPVIQSVAHGYALPDASLDLADFQRRLRVARSADAQRKAAELRAALELWQGTPLSGVKGDYAEAERVRLEQLRLTAIEDLAAADIDLNHHVEAVADLTALVTEHPFRERPRELLMLALYRSGRQAEALAVFDETRRVLAGELGLDPSPELREMHQRILTSDPGLAPAVTGATRPSQLPTDVPCLIGRETVLPEVLDALTSSAVVGLVGLAGVGKTALAVHAGHVADFPDGQLFVDVALSANPLAELLRGVGVSQVPESVGEQAALWRTLTTGRRLLIVLDDVRDATQLKSMLPGSGGPAVLVTSRRRLFGLPYVHWMTLDGLTEDASILLIERMIGTERLLAEPDAVGLLVRPTSGLPQVLTAIGSRLAARPNWKIADFQRRMRSHGPGAPVRPPECKEIEQPYESALHELSAVEARAFRLVALYEAPDVSLEEAAALLGVSPDETENLLEALVDLHLVETTALNRYRYRTPVKSFASGRAMLDDGRVACEAALGRLAAFHDSRFLKDSTGRADQRSPHANNTFAADGDQGRRGHDALRIPSHASRS
jgi:DNA-binding SARP family transcriptional activator